MDEMLWSSMTEKLSLQESAMLSHYSHWMAEARPKQLAPVPDDWSIWLILAGRGWGKTRTGAEDIVAYACSNPDSICAVVAPTLGDLRRTCMEGPSGILSCLPDECLQTGQRKGYNGQTGEVNLWNGSKIMGLSANEPDRLRGPQYHRAWLDELAAWRYEESFDQIQFGLRLGDDPKMIVTTTPRPTKIIKDLFGRSERDVHVTTGSTFENVALADSAIDTFRDRYEGTRLGRQELYAEILLDIENALWSYDNFDKFRKKEKDVPDMKRIVVGVDPAMTSKRTSDETGIVIVGRGVDDRFYVLDDASGNYTVDAWANKCINTFYKHSADRIVVEVNNGGDLVTKVIKDVNQSVPVKSVHATRGKVIRAEPIAALYEQGKVSHVGNFSSLEDQMTTFDGNTSKSPDRMDALVWAMTELNTSSGIPFWRIS